MSVYSNNNDNDISIFSFNDLFEAYRNFEATPEEKETILYFISELTGKSVDTLAQLGCE